MSNDFEQLVVDVAEHQRTRFFGKHRGTVKEVLTGDDLGKIVVRVPSVYENEDSPPAVACVPFAGPNHGFLTLPEVDDGVWVEFEDGDPSRPIWTGYWWASGDIPDPKGPKVRAFVTKEKLKIVLDDDQKQLQILHPGGGELTMTDSSVTIKFGSKKIEISDQGININDGAFKVS